MADEPFEIAGEPIAPGEYKELHLKVSEFYTSTATFIPVFVKRGVKPGPRLFVTAAVHGDEINGVQILRNLIVELRDREINGTFVGIPVVNRFGFLNHRRDMPDERDLNRSFPGSRDGSLAMRYANKIFKEIVLKCTHGIDLHTAGDSRTNLPQVRCDVDHPECRRMGTAFGANVILHHAGGRGTLRGEATRAGVPTIIYEAGETFKFQRDVVVAGKRGIWQVMHELGMCDYVVREPAYQIIVRKSSWVRADRGGLLDVYLRPGDLVYKGDEIAVITNPFGKDLSTVHAPFTGLVIGRVTLPLVHPGNPIAHLVKLDPASLAEVERILQRHTSPNAVSLGIAPADASLMSPTAASTGPALGPGDVARAVAAGRAKTAAATTRRPRKPIEPATE